MAYVQFYKLTPEFEDVTCGRVEFERTGQNVIKDMPPWLEKVVRERGATGPDGRHYTLDDGMAFLNALRYEFHGTALRASEVIP